MSHAGERSHNPARNNAPAGLRRPATAQHRPFGRRQGKSARHLSQPAAQEQDPRHQFLVKASKLQGYVNWFDTFLEFAGPDANRNCLHTRFFRRSCPAKSLDPGSSKSRPRQRSRSAQDVFLSRVTEARGAVNDVLVNGVMLASRSRPIDLLHAA